LKSTALRNCFSVRKLIQLAVVVLSLLEHTLVYANSSKTSLEISGIVFPCVNCEFTSEGMYKLQLKGESFLLRPADARVKLFESASADQLSKLNKTGDLLRFLLGQEVKMEEGEKAISALLATNEGRSTFIFSFQPIYQSHQRVVLKLLVSKQLHPEILESLKRNSISTSDSALELALFSLAGQGDIGPIIENQLDRQVSITLERLATLEQILLIPEMSGVAKKLTAQLTEIREALENTSVLDSSSYREAGLPPSIRRVMRKQRLLTLTGRALEATPESAEEALKELTDAWDATLDTPSVHEAFRHLIGLVSNPQAILGPIAAELAARDTTIQLMLNPPPPLESSLLAVGATLAGILLVSVVAIFLSKKRWKSDQKLELREGLTHDERRELQDLLAIFDLTGEVTLDQLKQAFRRKAKQHHPDSQIAENAENGDDFIELKESYNRAKELLSAFSR